MIPTPPHRFIGIQLETQVPQKFRVDWKLIILTVMVLCLRTLRLPWFVICVEDRGK